MAHSHSNAHRRRVGVTEHKTAPSYLQRPSANDDGYWAERQIVDFVARLANLTSEA
jgi:hypothetical protein